MRALQGQLDGLADFRWSLCLIWPELELHPSRWSPLHMLRSPLVAFDEAGRLGSGRRAEQLLSLSDPGSGTLTFAETVEMQRFL